MSETQKTDTAVFRPLKGWSRFKERGVLLVFVGLCLVFSMLTPNFRQLTNLINILRQISEISIAAIGMTYIIICAEIDLSVGSVYGLSAMIAANVLRLKMGVSPVVPAFLAALAFGALVGLFNGVITTKLKVPAFIVTLSVLAIVRGGVFGLSGGYSIAVFPKAADPFFFIGNSIGKVFPIQIIVMIVLNVIAAVVLSKSTYLYGSRGTILGTFIGAAIIGVVRNGMVLMSVPAYSQEASIGGVILVAVIADIWLRREKA